MQYNVVQLDMMFEHGLTFIKTRSKEMRANAIRVNLSSRNPYSFARKLRGSL